MTSFSSEKFNFSLDHTRQRVSGVFVYVRLFSFFLFVCVCASTCESVCEGLLSVLSLKHSSLNMRALKNISLLRFLLSLSLLYHLLLSLFLHSSFLHLFQISAHTVLPDWASIVLYVQLLLTLHWRKNLYKEEIKKLFCSSSVWQLLSLSLSLFLSLSLSLSSSGSDAPGSRVDLVLKGFNF